MPAVALRPSRPLPLAGVRIAALEQYAAGPWATLQLADMGADVIKVEDPRSRGDIGRYVPPFQREESSLFFEAFNRGKRSVSLDLRTASGRAAFDALVAEVDAVFCNLRGDVPERLGLTYAQLSRSNPRIVCCALTGYGQTGPRRGSGAYDYVIQGLTGWMSLTGEPDAPPTRSGVSLVDFASGYVAGLALLGGIWQARETGDGCDCDVSLYDTALSLLNYLGTWAATADYRPQRRSSSAHPSLVPFQNFPTADGWVVVACPKHKFWLALCHALDRPDLADDPRFVSFETRAEHRAALVQILSECFRRDATRAWVERLSAAGIPCAPINDVADALADPQARARETVVSIEHPEFGQVRHIASPLRVGSAPRPPAAAPSRGQHTQEILADLCGYTVADIVKAREDGAFG